MWSGDKLAHVDANPAKAGHVTLAVVLAGIESHTSKDTWRYPTRDMSAYFGQLTAWGYAASDVEQIVINHNTTTTGVEDVDDVEEQDDDTVDEAPTEDD